MTLPKLNNIKLIVCDIDGTLVGQSHFPSERTIKTIETLLEHGYLFAVASGRPVEDLHDYFRQWKLSRNFDYIIGWNGSQLYDNKTKEEYCYSTLSSEQLKEIIAFMSHYEANVHMYRPGIYLSSKETDRAWFSAFKNKRQFVLAESMETFCKDENCGIMFRVNEQDMPAIEKDIAEHLSDCDYVGMKTQPNLMEFQHKNGNKGYGLKKVCERANVSLDQCVAFGDTTNDNAMLALCHGVCLKNGSDDTKALAEYITDKTVEEEGWVEFVEATLL